MKQLSVVDARTTAVTASLGVVGLLVALVIMGGTNLLTVALALLGVLLAMIAGVSVAAARQTESNTPRRSAQLPEQRGPVMSHAMHLDADTLNAFEPLRDHRKDR